MLVYYLSIRVISINYNNKQIIKVHTKFNIQRKFIIHLL